MTKKALVKPLIERSSKGLRDAIFDEMDALRNGDTNPTTANATAKLAGTIIDTVRMEVEVRSALSKLADKPTTSAPDLNLQLGAAH